MFGQNKIRKQDDGDGRTLQVADIWLTIQGEGPFSGVPATFIRLTGCNLRCHFCDTQWDDENDPAMTVEQVVERCKELAAHKHRLVVLTGGEPLRQNVGPLISVLTKLGFHIQIETAGTIYRPCVAYDHVSVVVAPKTPRIEEGIAKRAIAYKYVIRADEAFDEADGLPMLSTQRPGEPARIARPLKRADGRLIPVYLQPCDEYDPERNAANIREVARRAMHYGYNAGLQMHKIFNVA